MIVERNDGQIAKLQLLVERTLLACTFKLQKASNLNNTKMRRGRIAALFLLVLFATTISNVSAFLLIQRNCCDDGGIIMMSSLGGQQQLQQNDNQDYQKWSFTLTPEHEDLYKEVHDEIKSIAKELWDGQEIPCQTISSSSSSRIPFVEGEARLPDNVSFQERGEYFQSESLNNGCPKAQHSLGCCYGVDIHYHLESLNQMQKNQQNTMPQRHVNTIWMQ